VLLEKAVDGQLETEKGTKREVDRLRQCASAQYVLFSQVSIAVLSKNTHYFNLQLETWRCMFETSMSALLRDARSYHQPKALPSQSTVPSGSSMLWKLYKKDYDMLPSETAPFLKPLCNSLDVEIQAAEKN